MTAWPANGSEAATRRGRLKAFLLALAAFSSSPAAASLADCQGLYVIRIYMTTATGLPQAVFAESPTAVQGSYWTYPASGLSDRVYQQIHATLITAKAARIPVGVWTNGPNNCGIANATHYLTGIELQAQP